jgi:hypothetical protein
MPPDDPRPRSGKISAAVARTGIRRSTLYKLASRNPGLLKKVGSATIVDFVVLDALIDQLPPAQLKQVEIKQKSAAAN